MAADSSIVFHQDGPKKAKWRIALAHGAGSGMRNSFMDTFAEGLGAAGFRVYRFEFPYMAQRGSTGRKRAPDREPVLRATWAQVIEELGPERLVIGGKSMGGRIASLIAQEAGVPGLVCLGYPFHAAGKPDRLRIEHLESLTVPTLIVQGDRDAFGSKEEVQEYPLSDAIRMFWLRDGDHSFQPRKTADATVEGNWQRGITAITRFIAELDPEMLLH